MHSEYYFRIYVLHIGARRGAVPVQTNGLASVAVKMYFSKSTVISTIIYTQPKDYPSFCECVCTVVNEDKRVLVHLDDAKLPVQHLPTTYCSKLYILVIIDLLCTCT